MTSNTRLWFYNYFADILSDKHEDGEIFHWIVQKVGSSTVLYSGQESTFEEARKEAQLCLESCVRKDRSRPA